MAAVPIGVVADFSPRLFYVDRARS